MAPTHNSTYQASFTLSLSGINASHFTDDVLTSLANSFASILSISSDQIMITISTSRRDLSRRSRGLTSTSLSVVVSGLSSSKSDSVKSTLTDSSSTSSFMSAFSSAGLAVSDLSIGSISVALESTAAPTQATITSIPSTSSSNTVAPTQATTTSIPSNSSYKTAPSPPVLLSAQFSSSGGYITVMFDGNTDQGFNLGLSSQFDCDQIFEFFGTSLYCQWTSANKVTITLNQMSTIVPGDSVTLLNESVKAQCFYGRGSMLCDNWAYCAEDYIFVQAPASIIQPILVVQYPDSIGQCDDLKMDASGSYASGGRSMEYSWSLLSPSDSELAAYVDGLSMSEITIPSSYLSEGAHYVFKLTATNFLNGTTFQSFTSRVSKGDKPQVSITGSSSIDIYRSLPLSLSAQGSISTCNASLTGSLVYTWNIQGHSQIQSKSSDPKNFKLSPYSLESGQTYSVQVLVNSTTGLSNSDSVQVHVRRAPLHAIIVGGAYRTVSAVQGIILDASSSHDENEKDGTLADPSFTWFCLNEDGLSCNIDPTLLESSKLNLTQVMLTTAAEYTFTVSVSSGYRQDNTSVVVYLEADLIPEVTVIPISVGYNNLNKVNPSEKLVIKGQVSFPDLSNEAAHSAWTFDESESSSFQTSSSLEEVTLTDLLMTLTDTTKAEHYLVISANEMVPGGTYIFIFSAAYSNADNPSFAQVTITTNEPPTSGTLHISPPSGESINDVFYLSTSNWVDDVEDYPFTYRFYYLDEDDNEVLLRSYEYGNNYDDVYLPEGYGADKTLFMGVNTKDVHGSKGTTYTNAQVFPYVATLAEAADDAKEILTELLDDIDTDKVFSTIQSFTTFMDGTNCTLAPDCALLNRASCEDGEVDHSCGSCLEGYVGSETNLVLICNEPLPMCENGVLDAELESDVDCGGTCQPCPVGSACNTDDDCLYGLCVSGSCTIPSKSCENDCNNHGLCESFDANGKTISSCAYNDPYCSTHCDCDDDFHGETCSLDTEEYQAQQELFDTLVTSYESALLYSDLDEDELNQQSSTMRSLASQISIASTATLKRLLNLTLDMVNASLTIGADTQTTENGMNVLSDLMETPLSHSVEELNYISVASNNLAKVLTQDSVPGEELQTITTENINVAAGVFSFTSPDSPSEIEVSLSYDAIEGGRLPISADVGSSLAGVADVDIFLSEFTFNPYAEAYDTNVSTISTVARLGVFGFSQLVEFNKSFSFHITLQNYYAIDYEERDHTQLFGYCDEGEISTKYAICDGIFIPYECTGPESHVNVTCSFGGEVPRCLIWGVEDEWDPDICQVEAWNSTTTICLCSISHNEIDRRLTARRLAKKRSSDEEDTDEDFDVCSDMVLIAMETKLIGDNFEKPFTDLSVVRSNYVVFMTMGSMFAIVVLIALGSHFVHYHRKKVTLWKRNSSAHQQKASKDEKQSDVYLRLWRKGERSRLFCEQLINDSEWIQLFMPSNSSYDRMVCAVTVLASILTLMVWECTMSQALTDDNTTSEVSETDPCLKYLDEPSCEEDPKCFWVLSSECHWKKEPYRDVENVIYISTLALILTIPCMLLVGYVCDHTINIPFPSEDISDEIFDDLQPQLFGIADIPSDSDSFDLPTIHSNHSPPPKRRMSDGLSPISIEQVKDEAQQKPFAGEQESIGDEDTLLCGLSFFMQGKEDAQQKSLADDQKSFVGGEIHLSTFMPECNEELEEIEHIENLVDNEWWDTIISQRQEHDKDQSEDAPLPSHEQPSRKDDEFDVLDLSYHRDAVKDIVRNKDHLVEDCSTLDWSRHSGTYTLDISCTSVKRQIRDPTKGEIECRVKHLLLTSEKLEKGHSVKAEVMGRFRKGIIQEVHNDGTYKIRFKEGDDETFTAEKVKKIKTMSWNCFSLWRNRCNEKLLRKYAAVALKLEAQIARHYYNGNRVAAEARLLKAAHRDYLTLIEKRAIERIEQKLEGQSISDSKKDKTALKESTVRWRHAIGWLFMTVYCFFAAYYVCLFGVEYGPVTANRWLKCYFISFGQEAILFVPLKLCTLYMVIPDITSSKIDPCRLHKMRKISEFLPSVQAAKRFSTLSTSKLILGEVQKDSASPHGHLHLHFRDFIRDRLRPAYNPFHNGAKTLRRAFVFLLFGWLLLMPFGFQDIFLEIMIAAYVGNIVIGLYRVYIMSPTTFWTCAPLLLLLMIVIAAKRWLKKSIIPVMKNCLPRIK